MTSRDLVKKTLEFRSPERVPWQLWTLPWAKNNHPERLADIQRRFPDDIVGAPRVCGASRRNRAIPTWSALSWTSGAASS